MERTTKARLIPWTLTLLLVGLFARPTECAAVSIELFPVRDNTLFQTTDGGSSSGSGAFLFFGANSQSNFRRAVLAFEFEEIPSGSTVDSVSLFLHVSQAPNEDPQPLSVHRVLANWGEGGSSSQGGAGAPSQAGDATWLHRFYPDSLWSSPGGDFSLDSSATAAIGNPGFYEVKGPDLASDVAAWLMAPDQVYGWLLQGSESLPSSARRIDSRENPDSTFWPRLLVHYTEPVPTESLSWGRVKSFFQGP